MEPSLRRRCHITAAHGRLGRLASHVASATSAPVAPVPPKEVALRDGRRVTIRALRPGDADALVACYRRVVWADKLCAPLLAPQSALEQPLTLTPRAGCADAGRLTLDEPSTRALAAAGGQKPDGVHLVLEGEDGQLYGEADYSWGPEAAQPAGWWWAPLVSASSITWGLAASIHDSPVPGGLGVRQA
eukprot:COSAG04_NODE_10977_length_740_cov_0.936037_1_plen_187_part_10